MGRPRKPTEKHKLDGTYRQDRHANRIDSGANLPPIEKPADLAGDAADLWDLLVRTLPPGVLGASDMPTLAGACRWWGEWRRWDRELSNPDSEMDVYKASILAGMAWKCYTQAASKLGLSPVDRARLDVSAKQESPGDALDEFTKKTARVVG